MPTGFKEKNLLIQFPENSTHHLYSLILINTDFKNTVMVKKLKDIGSRISIRTKVQDKH